MATHPSTSVSRLAPQMPAIVRLWILRLLVPLGGHRELIDESGFSDETLADALGLNKWFCPSVRTYDAKLARAHLRDLHRQAEATSLDVQIPDYLQENMTRLSGLVALSQVERQILAFAILLENERPLHLAATLVGESHGNRTSQALSILLDLPEHPIRAALHNKSALAVSGLLTITRGRHNFYSQFDLLSENFSVHMASPDADLDGLWRDTLNISAPAQLSSVDFEHIAPALSTLQPYLRHAIASGRKGVNIFLHGAPGTGKNQLAKVLAQELDCELFEISSEDRDGDPVDGERRLRSFRAAQSLITQRRAMILFDEVEDVFNDNDTSQGHKSTAQTRKAWINRILEGNSVPAFWLSNNIWGIDPAFMRRFDMVIELPVPPRKQRERILRNTCAGLLDDASIARIAESESLAPAVMTRAAGVVRSIQNDPDVTNAAHAFELLINSTLQAQDHMPIRRNDPHRLTDVYDPAFIHANADLAQIACGLAHSKAGRLYFYGPPGTGKTAYARWLAGRIGIPLLVKRASDLYSKWLGASEKNIARAFHEAEQDGALLLIDEMDSFLQDRREARAGWEVSQVNEMLTQMESFSGIFIATTNLMRGLDQAAQRRFDLKVKFGYLIQEQAWQLLCGHCAALNIEPPQPAQRTQLNRLTTLTPGDFAAVIRKNNFCPVRTPAALVDALEAECGMKEGARAGMGFL